MFRRPGSVRPRPEGAAVVALLSQRLAEEAKKT